MMKEDLPRRETKLRVKSVQAWLFALAMLGFGMATFASGCSVRSEDICTVKCNCEGCSQAELDDCVADVNGAIEKAQDLGCSSPYADWLRCVEEEAECREGQTFAWDGCDIEEDALAECSGFDACTTATEKLCNQCGTGCGEPAPSPCAGRLECTSKCVIEASCSEILSGSGTFATCVAACP